VYRLGISLCLCIDSLCLCIDLLCLCIDSLCLCIDSLCLHINVGPSYVRIDLVCVRSGLDLRDFKASALVRATQTTFYRYTHYMLLHTTPTFHAVV